MITCWFQMRQVGEGAARWKEMLKGTGTGLQSPTVNLSKQPKLSGPGAKVELGMRAPGRLDSPLPSAGPLVGAGGEQPTGTKGKLVRFPVGGSNPDRPTHTHTQHLLHKPLHTCACAHTHTHPAPELGCPENSPSRERTTLRTVCACKRCVRCAGCGGPYSRPG